MNANNNANNNTNELATLQRKYNAAIELIKLLIYSTESGGSVHVNIDNLTEGLDWEEETHDYFNETSVKNPIPSFDANDEIVEHIHKLRDNIVYWLEQYRNTFYE